MGKFIRDNKDRGGDESEVIYTYYVNIPFLNINDTQRIVGYAKWKL